jgi:hypothetical protein
LVLVVVLVLTILSIGRISGSSRDKIKAQCQGNLQKIFLSSTIYANDYKGNHPVVKNAEHSEEPLSLLIPRYSTLTEMFICPGSGDRTLPEGESFARRRISYAYYMGRTNNEGPDEVIVTDRQVDTASKKAGQQIFSNNGKKPGANHSKYGGCYVTLGGESGGSRSFADRDFLFGTNITLLNPR